MGFEDVAGCHDLMIHDYGYGNQYATVTIVLDAEIGWMGSVARVGRIRSQIWKNFHIKMTIQTEVKPSENGLPPGLAEGNTHDREKHKNIRD